MRTLIVYYSRSGRTKLAAEEIAEVLDADTHRIEQEKEWWGPLVYLSGSFASLREKCPKIKDIDLNLEGYDLVLLAAPVWAGKAAPAMNTFISRTDFTGKNVALLVTMGSTSEGKAIQILREKVEAREGKVTFSFAIQTGKKADEDIRRETRKIAEKLLEGEK